MKSGPSILFFDTEIAKNLYAKFPSRRPEYTGYKDSITDWWMICWAAQWGDSKKLIGTSVLDDRRRFIENPMDDYYVIKKLYEQIKETDVIIGHNMQKFDWKKFMARVTYHKMLPIDPPKIIDTMLMAKAIAAYDSYSLSFLCRYHGLPNKVGNRGNELWNDIAIYALRRDIGKLRPCIQEMVVYCAPDVTAVKALYEFLLPYAPARFRINQNLYHINGVDGCPCCKSDDLEARGYRTTAIGKYARFRCNSCGSWSQAKRSLKTVNIK